MPFLLHIYHLDLNKNAAWQLWIWYATVCQWLPSLTWLREWKLFSLCALPSLSSTRFYFTLLLFHLQTTLIFRPINFVLSTVRDKIQAWLCFSHCCRLWDSALISIISSFLIFKVCRIFLLWFFNLHKGYWIFTRVHFSPYSSHFLSVPYIHLCIHSN